MFLQYIFCIVLLYIHIKYLIQVVFVSFCFENNVQNVFDHIWKQPCSIYTILLAKLSNNIIINLRYMYSAMLSEEM